jgi:hypothetical protein
MVAYMIPLNILKRSNKEGDAIFIVKREKLLEKLRGNVRNVSARDFEALANYYGYIEEGAKHPKVIIGNHTLTYRREPRIKACYVKELLGIIESL